MAPASLCPGDAAPTATWDASGDLALTVDLDPAPQGGAAPPTAGPEGSHLVALRLVARRHGQEAAETRWIQAFPPSFANDVSFPAVPADGGVVAKGVKNVARWGDRFEVATLAAPAGQRLEVVHAGRRAWLPASGEASPDFAGTPLGGEWELRWQPADGSPPPDTLTVQAVVRCRRETP